MSDEVKGENAMVLQVTHITVWKIDNGNSCEKIVLAAVCHFCKNDELIATSVDVQGWDPKDYPNAVICGGCGMSGPWGKTEEEAVDKWNEIAGVEKENSTDWECHPLSEFKDEDCPF
jgi:hypothetical protein